MKMLLLDFLLAVSFGLLGAGSVSADQMDLVPFSGNRPAPQESVTVSGSTVRAWRTTEKEKNLVCKGSREFRAGLDGAVFLEVTYLDKGYGRLGVQFKGEDNKQVRPDKYTNINLTDSGKMVTAYLRLNAPVVREVQLNMERNNANTLAVSKVSLQDTVFKDEHFVHLLKEDWKRPYDGPSAARFDNQTLKGKIMVGYQGWFRTPNDPYDRGWFHWGNVPRGEFSVDMWPDVSAYPPAALEKAADVKLLSGKQGYLFSSAWPEVARVHFKWMRENGIDGAFVQRFLTDGMYSENPNHPEWILGNVRAAANREGLVWAVEYDISGYRDEKLLEGIKRDWMWLVDVFGLKKDPSYAREGGKLVVFIWGMAHLDRKISVETANAVADWFKNDPQYGGNYVIGGIPGNWRQMSDEWKEHYKKFDSVLCWMSQNYAGDQAEFKAWNVAYYPHVKPGFSWANLKHIPTGSQQAFTPRRGGEAMEEQIDKAVAAGADRFFIGMFDEYDESTAIIPMSDDAPPTPRRPGVVAKFFPNTNFRDESPGLTLFPKIDFELGAEPKKNVPAENFSMRWEGTLVAQRDGKYQLSLEGVAGDRAALWIDDKKVIEIKQLAEGQNKLAQLEMASDKPVIFRLEYAHLTGSGHLRLLWDSGLGMEPLPEAVYVDAWGRFLNNEGKPANHWMKLSGDAKAKMKAAGNIP